MIVSTMMVSEQKQVNSKVEVKPRILTVQDILTYLPHRYPFLLIDRIVDVYGDERGTGIKNVTYNEPCFPGHFPGRPIFPGVLIVEGMAQTAGAMVSATLPVGPKEVYFMTIDGVKFRKPVSPGDCLEYVMKKTNRRRNMWWYVGEAFVDGVCVAQASMSALVDQAAL
jgi:3-hydroxyacyl-[acyl-carrier-protein] dehydratase